MRSSPRNLVAFAATGLLAVGVAACGGSSSNSSSGGGIEFVRRTIDPAQGRREPGQPGADRVDQEAGRHADRLSSGDFEHLDPGESYFALDYARRLRDPAAAVLVHAEHRRTR